jgi:gas vesicle protein
MRTRDNREIIVVEQDRASGVGLFVLGAALGAGLALLLAPASGEETRERLRREARRLKSSAEDAYDDFKEHFEEFREDVEEKVEDAKDSVARATRALKGDGERRTRKSGTAAAREELERRLADARARRREPLPEEEEPVA